MSITCTYTYKGHKFNSESELNDFLLEKEKYLKDYSDIVFDKTPAQLYSINQLNHASKEAAEKKKEYDQVKKIYNEDGIRGELKLPYMGVNEFLDGFVNKHNKLLFPKFIDTEYWRNRFGDWANGKYTEDEIELFNIDKNNPIKLPTKQELIGYKGENIEEVATEEEITYKRLMEEKWKNQALFGDVIHLIGQKLFTTIQSGPNAGKLWIDIVDTNFDLFLKQIDPDKYDNERKIIRQKFTNDHIIQTINYFKTLKSKLELELNDNNLIFVTEAAVIGELNSEQKGVTKLLGRIDLLVVDSKGNVHVIDYKTSPKPYSDYNSAKKHAYEYQLATYSRILAQNKINYNNIRCFVAPIQLKDFQKTEDGYMFDTIKSDFPLDELTQNIRTSNSITSNLNDIISIPENLTVTTKDLITNVNKHMKIFFPEFGRKKSEEEIKQMIEEVDGFKKRTDLEKPYGYVPKGSTATPILANSEVELIQNVMAYYNTLQDNVKGNTKIIKEAIKFGIKENTDDIELPHSSNTLNPQWLRMTLSKYLNSNWTVLEGEGYDSAEEFGMIFIQNNYTKHVEIIKTSLNYLNYNPSKNPQMKNLTYGLNEADIVENSKPESNILEGTNGNIHLMEAMLVLNNMTFNDDINISQIHVVNPTQLNGTWAPNEQLVYSFNKLMKLAKTKGYEIGQNNLNQKNSNIRFATKAQLALLTLKTIINQDSSKTSEKFKQVLSCVNALDDNIQIGNSEEILMNLEELKNFIENDKFFSIYIKNPSSLINMNTHTRELVTAYSQILWAIADYQGYNYKQQLQDHGNLILGFHKGMYKQELENPGNYASNILNTSARVMQEAYQNVRDVLSKEFRQIYIAVDKLKEKEGFSKLQEYTFGNQSKLYSDIVYQLNDGDLMVKNPWDPNCGLNEAKKEFTKMFLMEINKDRYPKKSETELKTMIAINDYDFFKLPLVKSSSSGRAAQRGILDAFKQRASRFFDKTYYKDKVSQFLSDEDETLYKKSEEIFKMNNIMDTGNGANRKSFIANKLAKDKAYFEIDLENILLIHKQAYALQREMDSRMPIIKAAAFALKIMGDYQGTDFNADYKTIEQTVKTKIKNESLIDNERMKVIAGVTKDIQQVASFMALAFAPIQASGQTLNGIFTDIKLNWVFDREIFSKKHLIDSFQEVGRDLVHFGTTPTLCEAINKVYGINDMDMNTYAKNLSSNRHGIFHFMDRYAFKMSSRPDFYNRMTIFLSQMRADGCYDAVSLNKDGTLKYTCEKDKRYSALWNSPKGSKEYNEALARYIPVAKQFMAEKTKNPDGTLFEFNINNPKPLPRMYTVQEAESRKDVADSLYGYYDHTKKALFFGQYLGSLLGQMRTYWSAKKNQYFAPKNSNQIKGRHVHLKNDDGKLLYYKLKENGEIDYDAGFITKEEGGEIEVIQWQGDYSEGVIVTLAGICKEIWNNDDKSLGGMLSTIKEKFTENPDERYRRCYVSNLKLLAFDMISAILLGALCLGLRLVYDDLEDEAKKSEDLTDVILADAFGLVYKTFNYAKLDFFWWESILSPTLEWNPFALSYLTNAIEQVTEVATGDRNVFSAIAQSFGVAKQNKPLFRYLAQQTNILDEE